MNENTPDGIGIQNLAYVEDVLEKCKTGESQLPAGWDETLNGSGMEAEGEL